MSAREFAARLAKTNGEITKLVSELEALKARKADWLSGAKPARDMQPLSEEPEQIKMPIRRLLSILGGKVSQGLLG